MFIRATYKMKCFPIETKKKPLRRICNPAVDNFNKDLFLAFLKFIEHLKYKLIALKSFRSIANAEEQVERK